MTAHAYYSSPLGRVSVLATSAGLARVTLDELHAPLKPFDAAAHAHVDLALRALDDYFAGRPPALPPLDPGGSEFDRRVWDALVRIPWGETRTYGAIAASLGIPGAARAVGAANGRNPLWILVPCHRVVAAGGHLGGYAGGLAAKRWLLAHEARSSRFALTVAAANQPLRSAHP
jgi:methylated-DNA-[protein]-cysteine S-methyltransferase